MKIIEIDNHDHGDSNNNDSNKTKDEIKVKKGDGDMKITPEYQVKDEGNGDSLKESFNMKDNNGNPDPNVTSESLKLIIDEVTTEKEICIKDLVPPMNSVQFMSEWKNLKGQNAARNKYLSVSFIY